VAIEAEGILVFGQYLRVVLHASRHYRLGLPERRRYPLCRQSVATAFGGKNINAQVGIHLFGEANRWHL